MTTVAASVGDATYVTLPFFVALVFCAVAAAVWIRLELRDLRARGEDLDDREDRHYGELLARMENDEGWTRLIIKHLGLGIEPPADLQPYQPETVFTRVDVVHAEDRDTDPGQVPTTWPDVDTDEIPVSPVTVPDLKVAAKVAPLPVIVAPAGVNEDWETARDRILAEATAEIEELSKRREIVG
jgi:hypothetical protein